MQTKLSDGSIMVCGNCGRDGELEFVGDNAKRKCRMGLAVGKRAGPDGEDYPETVWCNVEAWHDLASVLSRAHKGDPILVIGKLKTNEYNGKVYTNLVAEFVSVCAAPSDNPNYCTTEPELTELEDDGELPF